MQQRCARCPSGMTLIEVLIALSLFALLSILGMRAIETMEKQGGRLDLKQADLVNLSQALMLFESDLAASRSFSANLAQTITTRFSSDRAEFEMTAPPQQSGGPLRYVRWVIDGREVRRYPDRSIEKNFSQWKGIITRIELSAVQDSRKLTWSDLQLNQPVQALEFRFRLQDNSEVTRLIAVGRGSL